MRLKASFLVVVLRSLTCGLSIRPVLKHGPRSLTCVRVGEWKNLQGARKLIGGIPLWGAPPTDLDLLRRV
ncbi:unnamed protein product [Cuscuta campestris]|uniref:Secreted protein n=1 Tax=Cuscuta campestris TaxID=132261 RepID=A0A484NJM9_9ASTE|nr:unnamed protein product [Cuscuta campestris]